MMKAADCGNWLRAGRGQLAELGRRVALLEEQARRREEELAGAGRWTARYRGRASRCGVLPLIVHVCGLFAFQALRSQAGSSQLNRVARADRPAAGHSARVRLTSTVSTSARTASWFVAHPYWVAPEENSRMLAPCELRVAAPTCNVKPTGRALSTVR